MPMAFITLADDLALQNFQRGKERGCAIAFVVMSHGAATSFLQRQAGLRSVQGLDLAFLVNTKHQGLLGRIKVEANNIRKLFQKASIPRQFEILYSMWL